MESSANRPVIIYAEYCHDLVKRYASLMVEMKARHRSRMIIGVFILFDRLVTSATTNDLFDEVHYFAAPERAVAWLSEIPHHRVFAFIDHNSTIRDYYLFKSLQGMKPKPVVLLRNKVSLMSYFTTGQDEDCIIGKKIAHARKIQVQSQVKAFMLGWLAKIVITAGKLKRAAAGSTNAGRRILFVKLDLLGDMVVTLPYLAALRKANSDAELTVLTSGKGSVLLKEQEHICPGSLYDHLIVWDAPWHRKVPSAMGFRDVKEMLQQLPALWKHNYDIVIQPVNFGTGILFAALCLGKRVIAPIDGRLPLSVRMRLFVTDPVTVRQDRTHHMRDLIEVILERARVTDRPRHMALLVDQEARDRMVLLTAQKGHDRDKKLILVNTGAGHVLRRWSTRSFGELIKKLSRYSNCTIALTGTHAEQMLADEVERFADIPVLNTAGNISLNELVALISIADMVITADTSVMHIAAALNKPLVAIFGASLVDYCAPLSTQHVIVNEELGCSGCGDRCFADGYPPCLAAVSPTMVFEATRKLLMKGHDIEEKGINLGDKHNY